VLAPNLNNLRALYEIIGIGCMQLHRLPGRRPHRGNLTLAEDRGRRLLGQLDALGNEDSSTATCGSSGHCNYSTSGNHFLLLHLLGLLLVLNIQRQSYGSRQSRDVKLDGDGVGGCLRLKVLADLHGNPALK